MGILYMILPYFQRFKAIIILVTVAALAYLITMRWPSKFAPPILWIGGAILITAVILLTVWLLGRRGSKKSESALAAGISEAEGDKVDLKGEIQALRENWIRSIEKLKASGVGGGTAALSLLPWYIIIGEPASGKSTLLRKSGLDFPVGDAAVTGLHGTRNCDWWFANEAIFLDTAGRYIIETQQAEWVAFLNLLKKHRKKKPINGVMIALPANSLLTKSPEELEQDGKRIRARVDQLIELLGVNFPIYVLVTKVDLVAGFRESFRSLDQRHAAQMVGWTNAPEESEGAGGEAFEKKFGEVAERIYRMRPWRETQANRLDLMKTFLFPEEFQYLSDPLRTVLDVVFRTNLYQETPICRGVYFSSGTQVGGPLSRALEDMARDLNIPAEFGAGLDVPDDKELRAYFIKDLVSNQILRDRDMQWRTQRAEKRVLGRRRKWGIVGVVAAAVLALFSAFSWNVNRSRLSDFELSLESEARPLEAARDCLAARDAAVSPGVFDIGLNFSDEIIPSTERSFRKVFGEGCVAPLASEFRTKAEAGLATDENGRPDLDGYLALYGRFETMRRGLAGELPAEASNAEQDDIEALLAMLKTQGRAGDATPEDLRRSLSEYGSGDAFEHFAMEDQQAVRDEYLASINGYLDGVERWVSANLDATGKLKADVASAVAGLRDTCDKRKNDIVGHSSPNLLLTIAEEMTNIADPAAGSGAPGEKTIGDLAVGVKNRKDLQRMLLDMKSRAPEGSAVPGRVDELIGQLDLTFSTEGMDKENAALEGIVAFLDKVRNEKLAPASYDESPSRDELLKRQKEIESEIETAGGRNLDDVWESIKPHVVALSDVPVEKEVDGETRREKGWWDGLLLLAQARRADLRMEEYLKRGLSPYMDGKEWYQKRSRDQVWEILDRARMDDLVLPRLREQVSFYDQPLVAGSLQTEARELVAFELNEFLGRFETHWKSVVEEAVRGKAAGDVSDVGEQLGRWTNPRSKLLIAITDIRKHVSGIQRLAGPEDDPVLEFCHERCQKVFAEFAFFLDSADPDVRQHYTADAAGEALKPFAGQFAEVAGSFGSGQKSRARELTTLLMEKGPKSSYRQARGVLTELEREGRTSVSVERVHGWMKALLRNAWTALVQLTADDVNAQWERLRGELNRVLRGGDPQVFLKIFGPGGKADEFEETYLKPYFDLRNFSPIPTDGVVLEVEGDFRGFRDKAQSLQQGVFGPDGGYRKDRLTVGLKIGGTRASGLVVEYGTTEGKESSKERRTDNVAVDFAFTWSPETCRAFRFVIGFPGDKTREITFNGPWAVAEAFAKRDRVTGDTYIWSRTDPEVGDYEVILTVKGGGLGPLCSTYTGGDPLEKLADLLPDAAVRVGE